MPRPRHADLLIVGGGVAAARCARTLRRARFEGSILIVGDEPLPPYNRPPLSKEAMRDDVSVDLLLAEPLDWYARHAVELWTDVAVTGLGDGRAVLADHREITFDRCLVATGAEPLHPRIPGASRALVLRTAADATAIRAAAVPGSRAAIIGGGFIGVEVAFALRARGAVVTLVQLADALWAGTLGPTLASWTAARLRSAGVDLRLGVAVAAVEQGAILLPDGERLEADLVVAGVGVAPRVELTRGAGLVVDDGIVVDAGGRTSAPNVWAAGDAARVNGLRVEHWHAAREGGERAARSMLGSPVPAVPAPWVFTEVDGIAVDVVGAAPASEHHADEVVIGDPASGRFGTLLLAGGRPAQIASVGGWADVDVLRTLVERRASLAELRRISVE